MRRSVLIAVAAACCIAAALALALHAGSQSAAVMMTAVRFTCAG